MVAEPDSEASASRKIKLVAARRRSRGRAFDHGRRAAVPAYRTVGLARAGPATESELMTIGRRRITAAERIFNSIFNRQRKVSGDPPELGSGLSQIPEA
jgi:urease gamma subunit